MLLECPESIGRPFLGDAMCVVDDAGKGLPDGTIGRLAGGELAGFTCYTARPTDTAETKRRGLIISEDLGWCDEKGRFFISGRIQERVVLDDQQVFLPQLEHELRGAGLTAAFCLTHRPVGDSAEIGLVFEAGTTTEANVKACLARVFVPVKKIAEVAALPRTASGKIDRAGAAQHLWPAT
jgi:acyl-coenzyme A synthetase/AMP-(fatty) acid ligase